MKLKKYSPTLTHNHIHICNYRARFLHTSNTIKQIPSKNKRDEKKLG